MAKKNGSKLSLSKLNPAEYNPRTITDEALEGLSCSLVEFGDLSGIVFNLRTSRLVAGHQRVRALRESHGDLTIERTGDAPDGLIRAGQEVFKVRFVDWPESKEKAANIAANSPTITGHFTPEIFPILEEIRVEVPQIFGSLQLESIYKLPFNVVEGATPDFKPAEKGEQGKLDQKQAKTVECPECGHEFTT